MSSPTTADTKELISQVYTLMGKTTNTDIESCDTDLCRTQTLLKGIGLKQSEILNIGTSTAGTPTAQTSEITTQVKDTISTDSQNQAFITKLRETMNKLDTLQTSTDNLKLLQITEDNAEENKSLNDIFGITITPFEKEGFDTQDLPTIQTINQEISFSYKKNEIGKFINIILYIIYYVLAVLIIIYMFANKTFDVKVISVIGIIILALPLLSIIKYIVYLFTMLKIFV